MTWKPMKVVFAALLWLAPASSFAAPVTFNLTFSGTGFVDEYGTPAQAAPFSSIAGDVAVTFDPTLNYEDQSSGLIVRSFTGVPVSSPLVFSYFASDHEFYLGGSLNDAESTVSGTDDVLVAFNLSDVYKPMFINCTDPDNDCVKGQGDPSLLVTDYTNSAYPDSGFFLLASGASVAVPEPSSLAVVLTGVLGLGAALLRRLRSRGAKNDA